MFLWRLRCARFEVAKAFEHLLKGEEAVTSQQGIADAGTSL